MQGERNMQTNATALVLVDFINEIVDPTGRLAGRGYAVFVDRHATLDNVRRLLGLARDSGFLIVHVRVGFSASYAEHSDTSPLLVAAKKFGALQLGTWATEFHPKAAPLSNEPILTKHRISAFYGTSLDLTLRANRIHELLICGVSTDLAVQSAARDAHDRDYVVTVVSDCCAAANDEDHEHSLRTLAKIAAVTPVGNLSLAAHAH
jgi:nicotinamidase-related amidase